MSRLPIYALLLAISSAALVFNQGGDATFSSVISGSLTKTGAGTPMLDGTNTYNGSTTISAGTLEVSDSNTTTGSIQGAVDVQGGGTLRGHGTIVGNITSDGIVWPGGSMARSHPGQLHAKRKRHVANRRGANASLDAQGHRRRQPRRHTRFDLRSRHVPHQHIPASAGRIADRYVQHRPGHCASTRQLPDQLQLHRSRPGVDAARSRAAGWQSVGQPDAQREPDQPTGRRFGARRCADVTRRVMQGRSRASDAERHCLLRHGAWAQYTGSSLSLDGTNGLNSSASGLLVEGQAAPHNPRAFPRHRHRTGRPSRWEYCKSMSIAQSGE